MLSSYPPAFVFFRVRLAQQTSVDFGWRYDQIRGVGEIKCLVCGEVFRGDFDAFAVRVIHRQEHWRRLTPAVRAAVVAGAFELAIEMYRAED
jgi:hypothetical protein